MENDYYGFNGEDNSYNQPNNNYSEDNGSSNYDSDDNKKKIIKYVIIAGAIFVLLVIILLLLKGCGKNNNATTINNTLKTLNPSTGTLSPEFTNDKASYVLTVNANEVTFECEASDSEASVSGCNESIKVNADSQIVHKITVTPKKGEKKVYTIRVKYADNDFGQYIWKIDGVPVSYTSNDVTISVELNPAYEYDPKPYSFDKGKTWTSNNTYKVTQNSTIYLYVKDKKGIVSPLKEIVIDKIDKTIPTVSINGNVSSNATSNKSVTLKASISPSEIPSGYTYQWYRNGSIISNANTDSYIATTSGSYKVVVKTGAGITKESKGYIVTIVKDSGNSSEDKAPSIPVINGVTGNSINWTKNAVTLVVSATAENGLHATAYSFDGGNTWQAGNTKTFKSNQKVIIQVRDKKGNVSSNNVQNITKIDTTAPTVTFSVSSNSPKSLVLTAVVGDSGSGVAQNGYSWMNSSSYSSASSKTITENGQYTVWVKDNVGNVTSKMYTVSTIQNSELTTPSIIGTSQWTNSNVVITIVSPSKDTITNAEVSRYKYYVSTSSSTLTGGSWITTTSKNIEIKNEGTHYVFVRGYDGNNESKNSNYVSVNIDKVAPKITYKIYTSGNVYVIKLTVTDRISGNYIWGNDSQIRGTFSSGTSSLCFQALTTGYYGYAFGDIAGNKLLDNIEILAKPSTPYSKYTSDVCTYINK